MISDVVFVRDQRALRLRSELTQSFFCSSYEYLLHHLSFYVGEEAKWWSRAKAYTSDPITPNMWGLMKVAGKRLYSISPNELDLLWQQLEDSNKLQLSTLETIEKLWSQPTLPLSTRLPPSSFPTIEDSFKFLKCWVQQEQTLRSKHSSFQFKEKESTSTSLSVKHINQQTPTHYSPAFSRRWKGRYRVVGAMLLDGHLQVLSSSLNHPTFTHTAHAEHCLLHSFFNNLPLDQTKQDLTETLQSIAAPLYLVSSLKPCKMCAGLWRHYLAASSLQVYYLEDDKGSNGQNTAFDSNSYAWQEANKWMNGVGSINQVFVTST